MTAARRWVVAIVGLLAGNAIAMAVLITSSSTGGAQVIPSYYDRAVHYDDAIDEARRSRDLGWRAEARLDRGWIEVRVRDRGGAPIDGARVRVSGYPRAHAAHRIDVEPLARGGGSYRAVGPIEAGWHDLSIVVARGGDHFTAHAAVEAP